MRQFVVTFLLVLGIAGTVRLVRAQTQANDPQLAMWLDMKKQLQGPNGKQYFELVLKDAKVPGPTDPVEVLRGRVISSRPSKRPSEMVLALSDDHTPEVTITLRDSRQNLFPLLHPLPPGTVLEFYGIPVLFTQEPFMLTFEVKAENGPGGANPRILSKLPPKK